MSLKRFVVTLLTALLIALFSRLNIVRAQPAPPPVHPNILFIFVDDMNTMLLPWGGQADTPNMDRIAAKGVVFQNHYAPMALCAPSRIGLLTGLRPASTGITSLAPEYVDWRTYFASPSSPAYQNYGPEVEHIDTLFDYLRRNGYWVASAGKTFHSNEQLLRETWDELHLWPFWPGIGWPLNRPLNGLTEYDQATGGPDWGAIEDAIDPKHPERHYTEHDLPDYQIGQDALTIFDDVPQDRPWLVGVGFVLPHLPWYVPARMLDRYPIDQIQLPPASPDDLVDIPSIGVSLVSQGKNFYDQRHIFNDDYQWRRAVQHYLAGISYVDERIGVILDRSTTTGGAGGLK